MAKKVNRSSTVRQPAAKKTTPAPQQTSTGMMIARILSFVCLALFIFFKELWIGTAAFGVALAFVFIIQAFVDKTKIWYLCGNLYGAIGCFVLAYAEYQYGIITKLMGG